MSPAGDCHKVINYCKTKMTKRKNDERGTRTPGMQGITGLAIPRHTGLGYLVTTDFKKRVPLDAFHIFNLFRGVFHNCFAQRVSKSFNYIITKPSKSVK